MAASESMLSIHVIKDHCRRGKLHPCIYFEGNIVCIKQERYQDSIDKRDPVAHVEYVLWSKVFKGYLSASNFIDYIDCCDSNVRDVFYHVDKIIEYIVPTNAFPALQPDEYLRAFPPYIDDDLREMRWLIKAIDFEGNSFRASDICFHKSEVKFFLTTPKESNQLVSLEFTNIEDPLSEINDLKLKVAQQEAEIEKIKSLNNGLLENTKNISDDKINFIDLSEYSTPALEALKGVIQKFWIPYNPETDIAPKQNTVMDWIANTYPEFSDNDYIKKSIDKLCRHPKAKNGGNRKLIFRKN